MARETFISYKYSEASELRDNIIEVMGEDARFYNGETADSPDLTDKATETIKKELKDMMFGTSVTIVVISPNITDSNWIDWEIEYTLKEIKREHRSRTNGVVGVVMKVDGSYSWFISRVKKPDGCVARQFKKSKVYDLISENRLNVLDESFCCDQCKTFDQLSGSYISYVEEEDFLADHEKYIENAYSKSKNLKKYDLKKVTR